MERDRGDVGVGELRHLLLDRVTGAVVEDAVPHALVLPLGEEHGHLGLAIGQLARDALHRRAGEAAVGAGHQLERDALEPQLAPLLGELCGVGVVDDEVHRAQLVGREAAGVLDGAGRGGVEPVDEHEHDVAAHDRRGGGGGHLVLELDGLALVLPVQAEQQHDQHREDDQDHPRALGELRDRHDEQHDERQGAADALDHDALAASPGAGG